MLVFSAILAVVAVIVTLAAATCPSNDYEKSDCGTLLDCSG
jgi:hypothetical protein